jgi:ubiquinone/menaquinone biosynthesis C-methylase UbiE
VSSQATIEAKEAVREFWDASPCGTRYVNDVDGFAAHAQARYSLEPHIWDFADFASARGKRVLEVGVGIGADYLEWLKAGALATGIDLSSVSLAGARRRCHLEGYEPDLRIGDAEHLPFGDHTFDIVYSYGVLHHSPDTRQCLREAWRVLKPSGQLKIMVYHHPSLTALMLWLRFGLYRGESLRKSAYRYLESPGTKCFTKAEVVEMLSGFENITMRQVFSPGDLLLHRLSERFSGGIYEVLWKLYPSSLMRRICPQLGLFLLVTATKPNL